MDLVALDFLRDLRVEDLHLFKFPAQHSREKTIRESFHAFEILQCVDGPDLFLLSKSVIMLLENLGSNTTYHLLVLRPGTQR